MEGTYGQRAGKLVGVGFLCVESRVLLAGGVDRCVEQGIDRCRGYLCAEMFICVDISIRVVRQ